VFSYIGEDKKYMRVKPCVKSDSYITSNLKTEINKLDKKIQTKYF